MDLYQTLKCADPLLMVFQLCSDQSANTMSYFIINVFNYLAFTILYVAIHRLPLFKRLIELNLSNIQLISTDLRSPQREEAAAQIQIHDANLFYCFYFIYLI